MSLSWRLTIPTVSSCSVAISSSKSSSSRPLTWTSGVMNEGNKIDPRVRARWAAAVLAACCAAGPELVLPASGMTQMKL